VSDVVGESKEHSSLFLYTMASLNSVTFVKGHNRTILCGPVFEVFEKFNDSVFYVVFIRAFSVLQVNQTSSGSLTYRWKSGNQPEEIEALPSFLYNDYLLHLFHENHCVLAQGTALHIFNIRLCLVCVPYEVGNPRQ
jgi:glycogen debranching enzyme